MMRPHKSGLICLSIVGMLLFLIPSLPRADIITDELGRRINLTTSPRRIISLAPSITEMLYELGLGDRIVGVTTFSNYPPAARMKPRVGSYVQINVEKILALNPDLVIATRDGNRKESVELLSKICCPVYVIYPRTLEGILNSLVNIGEITGKKDVALERFHSLKKRMDKVSQETKGLKRVRVFMQIGINPLVTVGKNTFQDQMITLAGGLNIAGEEEQRYPRLSMEEILLRRPEVIVITSMKRRGEFDLEVSKWKRWSTLPAVRDSRVHLIDSDLVDRASPRMVEGLENLFKLIHPEANHDHT